MKGKPIQHLNTKVKWGQGLFGFFYLQLIMLFTYSQITHTDGGIWSIWILQCLPILVFLPGLARSYYRSYSWFCFLILLYFVVAVDNSFKSTAGIWEYLFVANTVLLFILAMLCSRWLQHRLVQTAATPPVKEPILNNQESSA